MTKLSNGKLYFEPKVQKFLEDFKNWVSFSFSIDGPKELHDACRIYPDDTGNFDDAYAAFKHYSENIAPITSTKVTVAPENLQYVEEIIDFFLENHITEIFINPIYEHEWTIEEAQLLYKILKNIADKLLPYKRSVYFRYFDESLYQPKSLDDNANWCGGTGLMLAFNPSGVAYPCLRYMESSLGEDRPPLIIGNVDGLYQNQEQAEIRDFLASITRAS